MADNKTIASEVLKAVGGKGNVISVVHCATRLRFKLKDDEAANRAAVEGVDGVISVVQSGGQFQVVIGNNVGDVYLHLGAMVGNRGDTGGQDLSKKEGPLAVFVDLVAGIFTPFLGVMAGTGILKGLLVLLSSLGALDPASATYGVLNAAGDALYNFLPMVLAVTAARKFGTNEFIAMVIAGAMLHPSFAALAGVENPRFLGFIPIVTMNYASSVIPILLAVFVQKFVYKFFYDRLHLSLRNIIAPAATILVMVPLTFLVVGPAATYLGKGISVVFTALHGVHPVIGPMIAGVIMGGLWQVLVIFGLHWSFIPISMANFGNLGYDNVLTGAFAAVLAQAAACFAVALRTRNSSLKSIAVSAGVSGIFGITEPAIYGVTLRLKRPFITACVAGAIGGAVIGLGNGRVFAFGMPSLLTLPILIDPAAGLDFSFALCLTGIFGAMILSFLGVLVTGFTDIPQAGAKAKEEAASGAPEGDAAPGGLRDAVLLSPLPGKIIPLSEVKDEAFSSGVLGKGAAILPEEGVLTAPCDGVVDSIPEGKHAVTLVADCGAEVLMHIGMDTVSLGGAPFTARVTDGQRVKAGDVLIEFDIEAIKKAGLETVTPVVVANSDDFSEALPSNAPRAARGDKLITLLA